MLEGLITLCPDAWLTPGYIPELEGTNVRLLLTYKSAGNYKRSHIAALKCQLIQNCLRAFFHSDIIAQLLGGIKCNQINY